MLVRKSTKSKEAGALAASLFHLIEVDMKYTRIWAHGIWFTTAAGSEDRHANRPQNIQVTLQSSKLIWQRLSSIQMLQYIWRRAWADLLYTGGNALHGLFIFIPKRPGCSITSVFLEPDAIDCQSSAWVTGKVAGSACHGKLVTTASTCWECRLGSQFMYFWSARWQYMGSMIT